PAPFLPEGNSGTTPVPTPPTNVPGPPAANPPGGDAVPPQARIKTRDPGLRLAAFQQTGIPAPTPQPPPGATETPAQPAPGATAEPLPGAAAPTPPGAPGRPAPEIQPPPVGMDPDPVNRDLSAPVNPRPDLSPEEYRASEAAGSEMAGML